MVTKEDVKKYRELFGEWLVPIKEDKKPKSIRTGKNGVDGSWKWYDTEKKIFLKWSDEELIGATNWEDIPMYDPVTGEYRSPEE